MSRSTRAVRGTLIVAALAMLAVPAFAQAPYSEATPTKNAPLRFTAFAVQMEGAAMAGVVEITIERWSTVEERNALVAQVMKTTDSTVDQVKLLKALEAIKVRTGFLNTPNSMGWDIKYAHEADLPDGSRQLVIATDKPVSFAQAASGQAYDAAFTLIEMRFPKGSNKGTGKLLGQAGLSMKNGKLQIEAYVDQPTRLTEITEKNPKVKK